MQRPQPPYSVLIVEDEALLALDLEMIVTDAGHRVVADAMSLDDVKALPDDIRPVLALVDLHLADGYKGLEVSDYIRRQWPGTVVILVTANAADLSDELSECDGVIAKPFSEVGVTAALRYLEATISTETPLDTVPGSLRVSPAFERGWAA